MAKKPPVIDLSALEQAGTDFEQQEAARRRECEQEYSRCKQREAAWDRFEPLLVHLAQTADESFDRAALVEAFFGVCDVIRDQQLRGHRIISSNFVSSTGSSVRWCNSIGGRCHA